MLGRTLLHLAAINNDVAVLNQVFYLLEKDKSINHTILLSTDIENNWNLLHFAIYNFSFAFIRRVINYNSPIIPKLQSQKDFSNLTPWELLNSLLAFFKSNKLQPHAISLDGAYLTSKTQQEVISTNLLTNSKDPMASTPLDLSHLHDAMSTFKITKLVMSFTHTAFITADGALYVCGQNKCGQLGIGNFRSLLKFQKVDFFKDEFITDVEVTDDFTIVLTSSDQIYGFGDNKNLQMGTESIGSSSPTPQLLPTRKNSITGSKINRKLSSSGSRAFETLVSNTSINDLGINVKGISCSSNNSIAYTNDCLYFFGTNLGHFGTPSLNPSLRFDWKYDDPIRTVMALDKATLVLTENSSQIHIYMNSFHVKLTNVPGVSGDHEWTHFRPVVISKAKKVIKLVQSNYQSNNLNYSILLLYEHGEVQQMTFSKNIESKDQLLTNVKFSLVWKPKNTEMRAKDVIINDTGLIFICTAGGEVLRRSFKSKTKWNRLRGFESIQAIVGFKGESIIAVRYETPILKHEIFQQNILVDVGKLSPLSGLVSNEDGELIKPQSKNLDFCHLGENDQDDDQDDKLQLRNYKSENIDRYVLHDDFLFDFLSLHSPTTHLRYYDYNIYIMDSITNSELEIPVNYQFISNRLGFVFDNHKPIIIEKKDLLISIHERGDGNGIKIIGDIDIKSVGIYIHFLYTNEILDIWKLRPDDLGDPNSSIRRIKAGWDRLLYTLPIMNSLTDSISMNGTLNEGNVIIHLEDTQIKTWKFILSARCEFFKLTLANYWKSEDILEFPNIDLTTWKILMQYFVNSDLNDVFKDYKINTEIDDFINIVLNVCQVADQLLLPELSSLCQLAIKDYISLDNYFPLLQHSWELGLDQLFSNVCWFIFINLKLCLFDDELNLKRLDPDCVRSMENHFKDIVSVYFKGWSRPVVDLNKTRKKSKKFKFQLPVFEYEKINIDGFDLNLFLKDEDKFNGYYYHPTLWKILPRFFNESDIKRHEYLNKRKSSAVKIQLSENARQQQLEIQKQRINSKNDENDFIDDTGDFKVSKNGRRKSSRVFSMDRSILKQQFTSTANTLSTPTQVPVPVLQPEETKIPVQITSTTSALDTKLDDIIKENQNSKKKPVFKSSVFKLSKKERLEQQKKLFGSVEPVGPVEEPVVKLTPWGNNSPKLVTQLDNTTNKNAGNSGSNIAIVERGMATSLSQNKYTNVHFPSLSELNNPKKLNSSLSSSTSSLNSLNQMVGINKKKPLDSTISKTVDNRTLEEVRAEAEFERWWAEESKRIQNTMSTSPPAVTPVVKTNKKKKSNNKKTRNNSNNNSNDNNNKPK